MLALLLAAAQPAEPAPAPDCSYDLEAMLALDRQAFDQTLPDGGWRGLYERGCYAEAAELIRAWRHEKRDHTQMLYTHEGQMRAYAGQTDEAIALLRLAYKPSHQDRAGWNFYIDGTIAFLGRDREALRFAIERLKGVPAPSAIRAVRADGSPVKVKWPLNLDILEAFERCWERTYTQATASDGECRRPEDVTIS
ncbi:MAG: hypothetical protein GC147_09790 [Porphyrobacter sp.]|nr:hypothetical protein [Porphyrobacter sp.]